MGPSCETETTINSIEDRFKKIDRLLDNIHPKLPKGLRTYIRRLKSSGDRNAAEEEYRKAVEKGRLRRQDIARRELLDVVDDIFTVKDLEEQAKIQIKFTWLLQVSGVIGSEDRIEYLRDIIKSSEEVGVDVTRPLVEVRDRFQEMIS